MGQVVHIIMWIFVFSALVLIVTHAGGFATATNAVGGQLTKESGILTGKSA